MATAALHLELYGELRAILTARHFARGRYFRANHFSHDNTLGQLGNGPVPPGLRNTPFFSERPASYQTLTAMLDLSDAELLTERWRIGSRDRDNPILYDGVFVTCLAIEYHLGRTDALAIIQAALNTIGSLYKFKSRTDHFAGYIIRWDPATSDFWFTWTDTGGKITPLFCAEFCVDGNGQYQYCTPLNYPGYTPLNYPGYTASDEDRARRAASLKMRAWEPSVDEINGLVLMYDSLFRFVSDATVRSEVVRQVNDLGDYMAEHSYIMVRPNGGFSSRGAAGPAPALEFPFNQVFKRITGTDYSARTSFDNVMQKAGVWEVLSREVTLARVLAFAAAAVITIITNIVTVGVLAPLIAAILSFGGAATIAEAVVLFTTEGVFDTDEGGSGFGFAYLFMQLSAKSRFNKWMWGIQIGMGKWARAFPQFLGLTGLDDPDPTVKKGVLDWHDAIMPVSQDDIDKHVSGLMSSALAALLRGNAADHQELRSLLDAAFDDYQIRPHLELAGVPLAYSPSDPPARGSRVVGKGRDVEIATNATPKPNPGWANWQAKQYAPTTLYYMFAIALSWLINDRGVKGQGTSDPSTSDMVFDPSAAWPAPTIPKAVVAADPRVVDPFPGDPMDRDRVEGSGDVPLFSDPVLDSKPHDPQPASSPAPAPKSILTYNVIVRESDGEVDTGIELQMFDGVSWTATGQIWAGVWFTGSNGPDGWTDHIDNSSDKPLPGAHPFCLLYRRGGFAAPWNVAGSSGNFSVSPLYSPPLAGKFRGVDLDAYPHDPAHLWMRINDDHPGNGNGYFGVAITITRPAF